MKKQNLIRVVKFVNRKYNMSSLNQATERRNF